MSTLIKPAEVPMPSIDCPELSSLIYNGHANLLHVKQPEMIRKLETSMSGSKLAPFRNVEHLVATQFEVISKATLQSLPEVKALLNNETIERTLDERFRNAVG